MYVTLCVSCGEERKVLTNAGPDVRNLRLVLEQVLGKASSIKFTLAHVLMMAIVLMLLAVYNAIQKNNAIQEKQLALLQQKKTKRD